MSVRDSSTCPSRLSLIAAALAAVVFVGLFAVQAFAAPTIRLNGNGLDRFKFHGRVRLVPPSLGGPVDPLTSAFGVDLANDFGFIYRASLFPGDLQPKPNFLYEFRDRDALTGNGTRGGVYQVITRFRQYRGVWYYTVRIIAFADLSSATEPSMTVIFNEVDGMSAITAAWVSTSFGWRLPLNRF